jgi:uncharacterized SAM-binding protein YcdF (DUF218 family)
MTPPGIAAPTLPPGARAAIWLLCTYPETAEADERVRAAARLHRALGLPIWLFGSRSAQYPTPVETTLRAKLVAAGVPRQAVACSSDLTAAVTLDTSQEAVNVAATARARGIDTLVCVSNRLQLLQVRALLRGAGLTLVLVPTPLRDRRWWYVTFRLLLIPLAALGLGHRFLPLVLLRHARARLARWPI